MRRMTVPTACKVEPVMDCFLEPAADEWPLLLPPAMAAAAPPLPPPVKVDSEALVLTAPSLSMGLSIGVA